MIYTPPAGYYDNLTCNGAAITASKTHTATIVEIMRYKALMDLGGRGMLDKTYSINLLILRDWWKALDLRDRERIADVVKWSDIPSFDDILMQNEVDILDTKAKAIAELKKGSLGHTEIDIPVKLTPEQEMKERAHILMQEEEYNRVYKTGTPVLDACEKAGGGRLFDACKDKVVEDYYANYQPVASQYEPLFTPSETPKGWVVPPLTPEEAFKELMFEKNYVDGGDKKLEGCRKSAIKKLRDGECDLEPSEMVMNLFAPQESLDACLRPAILKAKTKELDTEPSEIAMKMFDPYAEQLFTPHKSEIFLSIIHEFNYLPFTTGEYMKRFSVSKNEAEDILIHLHQAKEIKCLEDWTKKTPKGHWSPLDWKYAIRDKYGEFKKAADPNMTKSVRWIAIE